MTGSWWRVTSTPMRRRNGGWIRSGSDRASGKRWPSATPPIWAGSPRIGPSDSTPKRSGACRSAGHSTMVRAAWQADDQAVAAVAAGTHSDPFSILGLHQVGTLWVARAFVPHADSLSAWSLAGDRLGDLAQRDPAGFFEGEVAVTARQPIRYRARNAGGEWDVHDPFSFGPVLGPMDDYYLGEGSHLRLFDKLGAHALEFE